MPDVQPQLLARIMPRLEDREPVWAVYTGDILALLVTPHRLFIEEQGRVAAHPIDEFAGLRRLSESLVILDRRAGPGILIPTDPDDEQGLQALTVIGLLVALGTRPATARAAQAGGAPGDGSPGSGQPGRSARMQVHRPAAGACVQARPFRTPPSP